MNLSDVSQEILRNPAELVNAPELPRAEPTTGGVEMKFSDQLRAYYLQDQRAMYSRWNPAPRPSFNAQLLTDINAYHNFLAASNAQIACDGKQHPLEYVVLASDKPGVFNLGGDLDLFKKLIDEQDRAELMRYGRACIEVLYANYTAFGLPISTISLVQGDALGGGFEAALSSDLIVAEKSARFGFPEILFNLFPGMGDYSFLDRRIGSAATEDLIGSGQIFSAGKCSKRRDRLSGRGWTGRSRGCGAHQQTQAQPERLRGTRPHAPACAQARV
jgi:DSF synthase